MQDYIYRVVSASLMATTTLLCMQFNSGFTALKVCTAIAAASEFLNFANVSAQKRPFYGIGQCGHPSYLLNALTILIPAAFLYKTLILSNNDLGFIFSIVWTADTAGLVCGKACSHYFTHKLTEWSPNKTLHGLYGALLFGTLSGSLYKYDQGMLSIEHIFKSFIVASASQIGDFLESVIKRHCGLKDSNYLFTIPGHGGILDRIDGLIFAILVY